MTVTETIPETLTVTVSPEDIREGVRGSCGKCPIALAALRACAALHLPVLDISVAGGRIDVQTNRDSWDSWDCWTFSLPPAANLFIMLFDSGRDVRPFTFTAIRIRPWLVKYIVARKGD